MSVSAKWNQLGKGEGSANGEFGQPAGIAVSPTTRTICVADSENHRLQWFNYDASYIRTAGKKGDAAGQFDCPLGVASTADGHFVVTDEGNDRVQILDSSGKVIRVLGSSGSGHGCFQEPHFTDADKRTGHLYVSDSGNDRVQIFRDNGELIGTFGSRGTSDGQFDEPQGIAVAQGRVVVADSANNRLQVFTAAGKHKATITGDHIKEPLGVVMNLEGDKVYVCCATDVVVYQLSPTFEFEKHIASPVAEARPFAIALLSKSDALVTLEDVHVVHRICL